MHDDQMKPQMPADDHEAEMARSELYRAAKHSMKLFEMIQEGMELEGWVSAKITKAADYLDSVYHYMEYQMKFGSGNVAKSLDDITGEAEIKDDDVVSEEDDEQEIDESLSYEDRLRALLEGKVQKKIKGKKAQDEKMDEEKEKPSAGMTKKEKSAVAKKARAGKDIGKPGKGFAKVEKAAKKGGAKDPKAVAAAAMWKAQAKK
jgi:hypothetical protein